MGVVLRLVHGRHVVLTRARQAYGGCATAAGRSRSGRPWACAATTAYSANAEPDRGPSECGRCGCKRHGGEPRGAETRGDPSTENFRVVDRLSGCRSATAPHIHQRCDAAFPLLHFPPPCWRCRRRPAPKRPGGRLRPVRPPAALLSRRWSRSRRRGSGSSRGSSSSRAADPRRASLCASPRPGATSGRSSCCRTRGRISHC